MFVREVGAGWVTDFSLIIRKVDVHGSFCYTTELVVHGQSIAEVEQKVLAKLKARFISLKEVMRNGGRFFGPVTGHKDVTLKFDIEGGEWDLFRTQFVEPLVPADALGDSLSVKGRVKRPRPLTEEERRKARGLLPGLLLFELHTRGANPEYVPPSLVGEAKRSKVLRLFRSLHLLGYRILAVDVNESDHRCAEFSLLLVE